MNWTKRQFIVQAFEEIGMANYVFDLQAEQLQAALRRLDSMMATWNALGLRVGYPIPSTPEDSDLDEETNVPDAANEAIYLNLALRLAPTVGKQVAPETRLAARSAYMSLVVSKIEIQEMNIGGLPSGQGHKPYLSGAGEYLPSSADTLDAGNDAVIDLE